MTEQTAVNHASAKIVPQLPDMQTVTEVKHYTDRLFSFRVTRPASLRFRSGEFVMIGLMGDEDPETGKRKPIMRAYSIASPSWDEELEFYSIKVQDGPLTSKLQHIQPGDGLILRPKPVGTLVHDALLPGKRLWFFATGTGFAPFASLLREPQTYEDYDEIIITHTCRELGELTYGRDLIDALKTDELLNEVIGDGFWKKIKYYPTTTREDSPKMFQKALMVSILSGSLANRFASEPVRQRTNCTVDCCTVDCSAKRYMLASSKECEF